MRYHLADRSVERSLISTIHLDGDAGDIILKNADCAEEFDVASAFVSEAEPGTVMIVDNTGKLRPASQAYDKRVAGIVSGGGKYRPGIILDRQHDIHNRRPLALIRAGAFDELLKCKTLLGIMAGRSFVTDSDSVGYLMMTRPSGVPGTVDILMPRVTGEPGFIGKAKARRGKEAVFTTRSGVQPGIFAMEASGRFSGKGELELDKVSSAATIRKKRRPKKLKAE